MSEGVAPQFEGFMAAVLAEKDVPMQLVHLSRRSGFGTICGSYQGQVSKVAIGITCPKCAESKRVTK